MTFFSHLYVNHIFRAKPKMYRNFLLVSTWKYERYSSNVGYFIKTAEFSALQKTAQSAKKQKATSFIWDFIVLGIYNFSHDWESFCGVKTRDSNEWVTKI